ncbi:MAG: hypothetical protein FWC50_05845 [Planctomycetaceae bacterium]|nr:hypothetical protein [Planctomycetaceae bacterium]
MNKLQPKYRCPSCWVEFRPEETLWIATSEELGDDPQLEPTRFENYKSRLLRFLPEHFTPYYKALDDHKKPCLYLACPYCHLEFPKSYLESKSFMTSIVGGQGTGKTWFLVSLVWWIQRNFSTFALKFSNPFADLNGQMNDWIERFFPSQTDRQKSDAIPPSPEAANSVDVLLPNLYDKTKSDYTLSKLIQPYMYSFNRWDDNQLYSLCLYDHAGEDFTTQVGDERKHLTKHLGFHDTLFFLFDPTQNLKFIEEYKRYQKEKELLGAEKNTTKAVAMTTRNDPVNIFTEMAQRIKEEYVKKDGTRLFGAELYDHPVVIVVPKCDEWQSLLDEKYRKLLQTDPIDNVEGKGALVKKTIMEVSNAVRLLLRNYRPDFVDAVEGFASDVIFIPVSATGRNPDKDDTFRPGTLSPIWIGVPLLYALARHEAKLVNMI